MEAYTDFAKVYAEIMEDIPYRKWLGFIRRTLKKQGIADGLMLDLACGTGEMTRRLRDCGYDMIGVDASMDMLGQASAEDSDGILYLNQDMRSFELYGTVRAIVSVCDSMNYLLTYEDLVQVLKLANNYLDPGGIFIFDLKTVHFYRDIMKDSVDGQNYEDCSYIWQNAYDPENRINEYDLTLFLKEGDTYRKSEEIHYQRAYTLREVRKAVRESGMEFLKAVDEEGYGPVSRRTERMFILAKEKGKREY